MENKEFYTPQEVASIVTNALVTRESIDLIDVARSGLATYVKESMPSTQGLYLVARTNKEEIPANVLGLLEKELLEIPL